MTTKSLHEVKTEERKTSNPNMLTDSDYYLRDKEAEARNGYPNTIDITGLTSSSQEEANDIRVKSLTKQLEDMAKMLEELQGKSTEVKKNRNGNKTQPKTVEGEQEGDKEQEIKTEQEGTN